MTIYAKVVAVLAPVLAAELAAKWWSEPPPPANPGPVLVFNPPAEEDWKVHDDLYREVQPQLRCSNGWIADVVESNSPGVRVASFSWEDTAAGNTLEAFLHVPEACMGSIGMHLERRHAPRIHVSGDHTLVFDSTLFRPRGGGTSVHVFKCVWVQGRDAIHLRGDVFAGQSVDDLRQLRIIVATTRYKPRHTRVIMGAVAGMPSEELAWTLFSRTALGHLSWQEAR